MFYRSYNSLILHYSDIKFYMFWNAMSAKSYSSVYELESCHGLQAERKPAIRYIVQNSS